MQRSFELQTSQYRAYLEQFMQENCFTDQSQPQARLFDAMRYSLLAGGKRLRPVFVLEFCRICGGNWQDAAWFACAVEMIHTYSLIHDDLPCMDNDDYRRGRLTNHKVYGEATAVLAGDALLTAAFGALCKAPVCDSVKVRAVQLLSLYAGELGMVGGQILDMQSEQRSCTAQEVIDIQSRKTGALIKAACQLGVVFAQGSDEQLRAAGEFADHIGLAFQIRDDMLDVIGTREEMGKSVGTDQVKNTFVQLYGIDQCDQLVKKHTDLAITSLNAFEDTAFLREMAQELIGRTN